MTDIMGVVLQGFSTGLGVIFANEFWVIIKGYRKKAHRYVKNMLDEDSE